MNERDEKFPTWLEDRFFCKPGAKRPVELDQYKQDIVGCFQDDNNSNRFSYNDALLNSMAVAWRLCAQEDKSIPFDLNGEIQALEGLLEPGGDLEGVADTQNALGFLYEKANNKDKARKYYRLAADQGYAVARNNLGALYEELKDLKRAQHYYQLAAEQGFADAQNNLGYLFENSGDLKQALHYYKLAREQGDSSDEQIQEIENLLRKQRQELVQTISAWIVRISCTLLVLLMSAAAVNFYINAAFITLMPFVVGGALLAGLAGLLSAGVFVLSWAFSKIQIPETVRQKEEASRNIVSHRVEMGVIALGLFGVVVMLALTLGSHNLLTPLFELTTSALLVGVKALADLNGLGFLTTVFLPEVVHALVMVCFLLAPLFLTGMVGGIAGWFLRDDAPPDDALLIEDAKPADTNTIQNDNNTSANRAHLRVLSSSNNKKPFGGTSEKSEEDQKAKTNAKQDPNNTNIKTQAI